jgi:hypothetical protein
MDSIQINNKYKANKKETKKKTKRYTYTEVQKDVIKHRLSLDKENSTHTQIKKNDKVCTKKKIK